MVTSVLCIALHSVTIISAYEVYQNKHTVSNPSPLIICYNKCLYYKNNTIYKHFEVVAVPEHFPELFELVVGHLGADGFQPLGHKALPQWLTDDIVRYQTQDAVQALLQLGHCAT